MAILHIIARYLNADELSKLVDRSSAEDGYAFIDDGVYVLLSKHLTQFSARSVYVLAQHGHERGLTEDKNGQVQFIEMSDLVSLTTLYPTSVSW